MGRTTEHSARVKIGNKMGFHVRPVQRFAEIARLFDSEVEVEVRGRKVPGKSVMNLMSLGARHGDAVSITARGPDARQCVEVLRFVAQNNFFVEDDLAEGACPLRHAERLCRIASCFDSSIQAKADGRSVDAKDLDAVVELGLSPASRPEFEVEGGDAEQARAVICNLVGHCFYVEEQMAKKGGKSA